MIPLATANREKHRTKRGTAAPPVILCRFQAVYTK